AHDAHHAAHLPPADHPVLPSLIEPLLPLAKRQIIDAVHLEVVRSVVTGRAAIALLGRQVLNSRAPVVVGVVDRLRECVSRSENGAPDAALDLRLQGVIGRRRIRLYAVDVRYQPEAGEKRPTAVSRTRRAGVDVDETHLIDGARADVPGLCG